MGLIVHDQEKQTPTDNGFTQLSLDFRRVRPRLAEGSFKRRSAAEKKLIKVMEEWCRETGMSYTDAAGWLSLIIPRTEKALLCALSQTRPKSKPAPGRRVKG